MSNSKRSNPSRASPPPAKPETSTYIARTNDLDTACEELIEAASVDLNDFIEFRFKSKRPTNTSQDYREGYTIVFETWLGGTVMKSAISIDLVVDALPLVDFDVIDPVSRIELEGLETHRYLTNTVENRIAEKVCATLPDYNGRSSSRVKDLVDLATSMLNEHVNGDKLTKMLATEHAVRALPNIIAFSVPDSWRTTLSANYRKLAKEAFLPDELHDVADTEDAVGSWLQPVLDGNALSLIWNPKIQKWTTGAANYRCDCQHVHDPAHDM